MTVADVMRAANKGLLREVQRLTGANAPATRRAASVLRRSIRQVLSTPGSGQRTSLTATAGKYRRVYGDPSSAGTAPHKQSGALSDAVVSTAASGARRVGFFQNRAWLATIHQYGLTVQATAPRQSRRKGARAGQMTKGSRGKVIPPRPFMERSLALAEPKMVAALEEGMLGVVLHGQED